MLAYAPHHELQRVRPKTLALIIAGHAVAVLLVMTARSAEVITNPFKPTKIVLIKELDPPPPDDRVTKPVPPTAESHITIVPPLLPPPPGPGPIADPLPHLLPDPGTAVGQGPATEPIRLVEPPIIRSGPHLATAADDLRPPYPASKRESGDETSLRLKLTIDAGGRVIAVDPVGNADPTFLETARRHILRRWHYQPAMEGARAIPSTTTITLKFELGRA